MEAFAQTSPYATATYYGPRHPVHIEGILQARRWIGVRNSLTISSENCGQTSIEYLTYPYKDSV